MPLLFLSIRSIINVISLYLVVAFLLSYIPVNNSYDSDIGQNEIYLNTNGVHLDIIIPRDRLLTQMQSLILREDEAYLAFGWGDRDFYINTPEWSDLTFNTAFKALFLKSETLMHVTRFSKRRKKWHPIEIDNESLNLLLIHIHNSFVTSSSGEYMSVDCDAYGNRDSFYEAKNSYNLFTTCNSWVNQGFKKAGIKTSYWTPFDFPVIDHIEKMQD